MKLSIEVLMPKSIFIKLDFNSSLSTSIAIIFAFFPKSPNIFLTANLGPVILSSQLPTCEICCSIPFYQ